jgi:hypothetical protein
MKSIHARSFSVLAAGFLTSLSAVVAAAPADAPAAPAPVAATPQAANPAADQPTTVPTVATEADPRKRAENSVYVEGLGAGILYSINYERLVIEDLAVRAGFSYLSASASVSDGTTTSTSSSSFMSIPITASYLGVGSKKHILELGGGMTFTFASGSARSGAISSSGSGMTPFFDALVGYRLHPVDGAGFNFRVGAMAMAGNGLSLSIDDPEAFGVIPWGYLSLGGSF